MVEYKGYEARSAKLGEISIEYSPYSLNKRIMGRLKLL